MQKNYFYILTYILLPNKLQMLSLYNKNPLFFQVLNNNESSYHILNFLDCVSLQSMYRSLQFGQFSQSSEGLQNIKNLILSFIFNKKYVNKLDRTMFYFIYQNQFFQQFDKNSTLNKRENLAEQIKLNIQTYNRLYSCFQSYCKMSQQQVQQLKSMITDPDIPLPVNLKSAVGKYCNSTFQFFVCSQAIKSYSIMEPQTNFQQLKNTLGTNQQTYLRNILLNNTKYTTSFESLNPVQKLKDIYFNSQKFIKNMSNNNQFSLIQGNELYNSLILIMQLSKNFINSIKLQLKSITNDPYARFFQLLLRYNVYKSYVLQMEEQLGFVFQLSEEIIGDLFNINVNNINNGFSAWKLLMKLFSIQMKQNIQQAMPVYINLVHKLKNLQSNQIYQKINFSHQINFFPQYDHFQGSVVLQHLLDIQNNDQLKNILSDFVQMQVDLSITQKSVLYCGHSQQCLGNIYEIYEQSLTNYQTTIIQEFKQFLKDNKQIIGIQSGLENEIRKQIDYLTSNLNIKPKTIKKILCQNNILTSSLQFETVDQQIFYLNKRLNNDLQQDLKSSQKSYVSAITNDSDDQISDIDIQGLQYVSQMSEQQSYRQQIDI